MRLERRIYEIQTHDKFWTNRGWFAEHDEYEEVTARHGWNRSSKLNAIEETIDDASEFIEEASKSAPPIKKAAGGLAYMLGE